MRTETVAEAFATYQARVLPKDASAIQIQECRRAFYAGAYFLLMNLAHNIGDDSTDEEQGIQELEKLKTECETFAAAGGMPLPTMAPPDPPDQSSYNVRSDEVERALRELAQEIKPKVPAGFGFTLLIYSYNKTGLAKEGPAGSMFYISSARRQDMVQAMREFITRNTQ
jgi:hypothetical protein